MLEYGGGQDCFVLEMAARFSNWGRDGLCSEVLDRLTLFTLYFFTMRLAPRHTRLALGLLTGVDVFVPFRTSLYLDTSRRDAIALPEYSRGEATKGPREGVLVSTGTQLLRYTYLPDRGRFIGVRLDNDVMGPLIWEKLAGFTFAATAVFGVCLSGDGRECNFFNVYLLLCTIVERDLLLGFDGGDICTPRRLFTTRRLLALALVVMALDNIWLLSLAPLLTELDKIRLLALALVLTAFRADGLLAFS